jgi:hypothetical protein
MDTQQLALLEMCKEHASQARQHESQRHQMTSIVVAIAAALVAFVGANLKDPSWGLLIPGLFIVLLGMFGAAFSRKHYERNRMHTTIMAAFRQQWEERTSVQLGSIREEAEANHNAGFPRLHKWHLHVFWDCLNGSVAVVGFGLVMVIVGSLSSPRSAVSTSQLAPAARGAMQFEVQALQTVFMLFYAIFWGRLRTPNLVGRLFSGRCSLSSSGQNAAHWLVCCF